MRDADMLRMANQIATYFESFDDGTAAVGVADHIRDFWEPRMREALLAYARAGGEGLHPLVMRAVSLLEADHIVRA